jgi:hypothetical protein
MLSQSKIFNSHKKFQKPLQILLIIFYFIDDSVGKRVNNQQLKKKSINYQRIRIPFRR